MNHASVRVRAAALVLLSSMAACAVGSEGGAGPDDSGTGPVDAPVVPDAENDAPTLPDADNDVPLDPPDGAVDAAVTDTGSTTDTGSVTDTGSAMDAGVTDTGVTTDGSIGRDVVLVDRLPLDVMVLDGGVRDGGVTDTGVTDAGTDAGADGGCGPGSSMCGSACINHSATTLTCPAATVLGTWCGDSSCGTLCGSTSYRVVSTRTGTTSTWFRVRVAECSLCVTTLRSRVNLAVPPGVDYDLFVYKPCGSLVGSSIRGIGLADSVEVTESDSIAIGDDFDYYIEVRYLSGTSCTPWTLTVEARSNNGSSC